MQKNSYIRFDWAIKRLLRDKANFSVLEGLLTVLLCEEIRIKEIIKDEKAYCVWDDAQTDRIDIKAKDKKGDDIVIRIQNMRKLYYLERIRFGTPAFAKHIYQEVNKVYLVSILYFDLGKGNDYLYHGQNRFIGVHTNDELLITAKEEGAIIQKLPQEVFPEYYLIRVNEFNQVAKTPLEEWVKYLKTGIIDPDTTAPGLPEAREKLRYYDMSPEERHEYDEHVNAIMIQNDVLNTAKLEGHAEGRAEGRAEGKLEDARNLKQLGVSIDIIAQATGLSREEIGKL
ncbi:MULTISPECIES: PD-(D/E)XK nuclease family transposase [Bacteroides]|uniref:PD-(D/E)XK nuclease family transposase n=1 Tax=Bacteroides TaxID=816 RepID=UPI00033B53B5|nr:MULTISPECIES: PD-(D/E)XK nuclease family transposase [Bacteroides]MBM6945103.1 PD-(D/E)XK nuclease family transposase [Bacteroides gallinaceum]OUO56772.1 hypothetical protein B5F78_08880 [Bacteroides sp. An279]CCZ71264.1 uncharacterized protein BN759_00680 [Bacteroides sp. CAG:702]